MTANLAERGPRTVLVCHEEAALNREGLAAWLASWSQLAGIVVLREKPSRKRHRVSRERRRVGLLRMLDVFAFRVYDRLRHAAADREWERTRLAELKARYPAVPADVPVHVCASINSKGAEDFLRACAPDLMIARCKQLLRERIFSIPKSGTYVFHPGICPRYRNAHGCFWALAENDPERVGMTLLRIDAGIDTGPIYGHYTYDFDAARETHHVIQARVVLDNLQALQNKLLEIHRGEAVPLEVSHEDSAVWGQPWLTAYLRWRRRARRAAS